MSTAMDKKSAVETLIRCIVVAQNKGSFSIKDAALMYRVIVFLRGGKDEELKEMSALDALVRGVVLGNSKGAYNLEEASVIDRTVTFLVDNKLVTTEESQKQETVEEPPVPEQKIVEI